MYLYVYNYIYIYVYVSLVIIIATSNKFHWNPAGGLLLLLSLRLQLWLRLRLRLWWLLFLLLAVVVVLLLLLVFFRQSSCSYLLHMFPTWRFMNLYDLVHSRHKMLTCNMSFIRLQLANLGQFTRFEQVPDVSLFRVELLAKDISNLLEAGSQESCLDPMLWWHGISVSYHSILWYESFWTPWWTSEGQWTWTQSTCVALADWNEHIEIPLMIFWEVSCSGQGWNGATRSLVGFSSFTSNFDLLSLYFHVFFRMFELRKIWRECSCCVRFNCSRFTLLILTTSKYLRIDIY